MRRLVTKWLSLWILKSARWVAFFGTLLGIAGAIYSVQLYKNLRTNVEELLPTTARSVVDLNEVTGRLAATDNLAVLAFSEHTQGSKRFMVDLAKKLETAPANLIAGVEYRIDREIEFFRHRRTLYLDLRDLRKIRDYLQERIRYETELYNPLNIFSGRELPEPELDLYALRGKYSGLAGRYERFPDGFYATPDGTKRVMLIGMAGKISDIDQAKKITRFVEDQIEQLNPKSYAPDLQVRFAGNVQNLIEEHEALIEDLELSTVIVVILVTLAMIWFFRNAMATAALVVSLFMGTLWTFGVAYFLVGYLNANSAFLGSIVIGNGINFGIILLARYLEELREGSLPHHALTTAIQGTATSTGTAALAAGLSYGSLTLTSFRGFNQFGVIGLIGMILCWISAYTLLPSYLILMRRWIHPGKRQERGFSHLLAKGVARHSLGICILSALATVVSVAVFTQFRGEILETDLSRLRSKRSMEHGSAYLSRYLNEIFQRDTSPLVILADTRDQARTIATRLRDEKKDQGEESPIGAVQTLDDFIPTNQKAKIEVLREIQEILPERLIRRMDTRDRRQVRELLSPLVMRPVRETDLPELVLSKFTEKNGARGRMILVEQKVFDHKHRDADYLIEFIGTIRESADSVTPNTPVAGQLAITTDMIGAITRDGPRATLFALLAVVILVLALFRKISASLQILFTLFLGVFWLAGVIFGFDLKINFLNFIALPITFGIGVDYVVNILQRYRLEGRGSILSVIRHTGGAVALASLTTMIGYGSLLIASNRAFVSFGTLAVLGELTCIIAAVVSLPAFLYYRDLSPEVAKQAEDEERAARSA